MISLRAARPNEGAALALVFGSARAAMAYLPVLHTAQENVVFFSACVARGGWVEVAEVAEMMVGFCAVHEGMVEHLYVRAEWQGRGIGGALLGRAMAAHPAGLSLWVFEENSRAQAFYMRAGFVEVERTDGRGNEEGVPDVRMRWDGVAT